MLWNSSYLKAEVDAICSISTYFYSKINIIEIINYDIPVLIFDTVHTKVFSSFWGGDKSQIITSFQ